ncbi:NAD(P)-binding domain-containing protein [Bradyrhizobium guangdongense]
MTGSPQVEAILTGEADILSRLRKGCVIVDCSTALPDSTLRMAAALKNISYYRTMAAKLRGIQGDC